MKPIAAPIVAMIQKRRMIFVSDHAFSSKWWCSGAIRKTRLRNTWKATIWISTESASITKMPPIRISSISVCVITARPGDRAAEPERAGVAHEDRRREGVEPEEADAGADDAGREQRELVCAGDRGDRDVGEHDDRRAAGGEAVEAVGEVDAAGRPGDDEVDQDRVDDAEVDVAVDEAQARGRR